MDADLGQELMSRPGRTKVRMLSPNSREDSPNPYDFCNDSRSDDDDRDGECRSDSILYSPRYLRRFKECVREDDNVRRCGSHDLNCCSENCRLEAQSSDYSADYYDEPEKALNEHSFYAALLKEPLPTKEVNVPLDVENNVHLWVPPPPEDEEDQLGIGLDDDDDNVEDAADVWALSISSKCKSKEALAIEQRRDLRAVVGGHFKVLVSQLLDGEGIKVDEGDPEGWLEIVTSLSLQAASIIKPDTSVSGGMDPGGYVKVKCIAAGRPLESHVVRGIVCKKTLAHRRMTTRFKHPRLLLLGGSLEFESITNHISSLQTLLQEEIGHISATISKIEAHHPNVLLVEKTVSSAAKEQLLAKEISVVSNIKRSLLERIARCTGASVVPNLEQLASAKVGHCGLFHVEKYVEALGSGSQGGKKSSKTLMFFEDCPRPLGCSILLKGSNIEELQNIKRAVQYAVFAGYHLALETSFLADEGANVPQLRSNTRLVVALPEKKSVVDKSISIVSPVSSRGGNLESRSSDLADGNTRPSSLSGVSSEVSSRVTSPLSSPFGGVEASNCGEQGKSRSLGFQDVIGTTLGKLAAARTLEDFGQGVRGFTASLRKGYLDAFSADKASELSAPIEKVTYVEPALTGKSPGVDDMENSSKQIHSEENQSVPKSSLERTDSTISLTHSSNQNDTGEDPTQEDFPPSPNDDDKSILVSFSSSCLRKGMICEHGHLFRIRYYGTFDKPLGKFLRENIFNTTNKCPVCKELKDAHLDCYTHRQGRLTISVHKQSQTLAGENEGNIWMWHRCLRCPRIDGIPPATHRIIMSDAAWGLSFGKFLELSFSNHAAASKVASCGHSLHRDCLRFYGFGNMVACFRYSPVNIYSVFLPPSELNFHCFEHQEWLKQEFEEIEERGEYLFKGLSNRLLQFREKIACTGWKPEEAKRHVSELEDALSKQKDRFQRALHGAVIYWGAAGAMHADILQLNLIRRNLSNCSSWWERCLQHLLNSTSVENPFLTLLKEMDFGSGRTLIPYISKETSVVGNSGHVIKRIDGSVLVNNVDGFTEQTESVAGTNLSHMAEAASSVGGSSSSGSSRIETFTDVDSSEFSVGVRDGLQTSSSLSPLQVTNVPPVHRSLSEGDFSNLGDVSATFDAAWTGEGQTQYLTGFNSRGREAAHLLSIAHSADEGFPEHGRENLSWSAYPDATSTLTSPAKSGLPSDIEGWVGTSDLSFSRPYNEVSGRLDTDSHFKGNAHFPSGEHVAPDLSLRDAVVFVYDDEPTSVIGFALVSQEHQAFLCERIERGKEKPSKGKNVERSSTVEGRLEHGKSNDSSSDDPMLDSKALHAKVDFMQDSPHGKIKYLVTCYYAKQFDCLRKRCCRNELDFIRSLCRCKKWGAQGGKSNVFFAKTADDRFVIKQVTRTELDSFMTFAPAYFKYISESLTTGSPTCLAKIFGIYQVTVKHVKGGKESRMELMIMENLLYGRHVTRIYDLKGSLRSRYNSDCGKDSVLLDQNLLESLQTNPIFISNKAKRLLERAIWNDTSFLAVADVMDYSLLVGIDENRGDLVLGIIDFMRQYTWDKHLETWVKASGLLGGAKNVTPTVISPAQYKKRFRKAMSTYFLLVPDQWLPLTIVPHGEDVVDDSSCVAWRDGSSYSEGVVDDRSVISSPGVSGGGTKE